MDESSRKFFDVISDTQFEDLRRRCNYYEEDEFNEFYLRTNDFINGYSLIEYGYGEEDFSFGEHKSNIIDANGSFVEIKLNNEIRYINGELVKLNDSDNGSYTFEVHRIQELNYKYKAFKGYAVESTAETSFFYIKVTRFSFKDDTLDLYFVINSNLKVIATFTDTNTWGNEYDGYNNCNVYTERRFFFINKERKFIVFAQKLIANSDERGFFEGHMYGLDPDLYRDQMREAGCYDDWEEWNSDIYEDQLDEETLNKIIEKSNSRFNENKDEDEDDEIPELIDINFFYDDINNNLYKDVFTKYYRELFGIINCKTLAKEQLIPFTDNIEYAIRVIWDRWRCEKEIEENGHYRYYGRGWDFANKHFYGYVMTTKFFDYPSDVKGFSLNYVIKFYPEILKRLIDTETVIIPNKLLNKQKDNELTRYIRLKQEEYLKYSPIKSVDDTLKSDEKYGLISSYQGQTLRQIIYSREGTKYLVNLIKHTNLQISKGVVLELINNSNNQIETNCYNIILSVLEDIEYQQELENDWIQQKMHEDNVREANREFDDMMNDFDAWGNLD